jgi:putative transposase
MQICVNMLLERAAESEEAVIERVLWIDSTGTDMFTIQINNPAALPKQSYISDLISLLNANKAQILASDPYAELYQPDSYISVKHRAYRDESWKLIEPLLEQEKEKLFYPSLRGPMIEDLAKQSGRTKVTLYKLLRRYWQGGMCKNALLPLFFKCGGKGQRRKQSTVKRGRPSKLSRSLDQKLGTNVTDAVLQRFRSGIKLFYENREGRTLGDAFQLTLERFFHKGYSVNKDGVLVPILPPASELPTLGQFKYWHRKERNIRREKIARYGESRYELSHRQILGNSTQMAFGPGSLFQIDATVGDVYLVSSLDRNRIIGRPVIYIVIDVFSRLITGLSVTLEGPSWLGAMLAIENATKDKVVFCKEYGFTIQKDEWPSCHLSEALLADRGELEGYNADRIVSAFNIRVQNTPPWRADWKGIVEQHIDLCNEKMIRWTPGAVRKRERGDRDYRLDAELDLHEFRQLMIACVLDHNIEHRMDWYPKDEYMVSDHVHPYPIDLWHWGVKNRNGHLRKVSEEIIRLNLLPEGQASVTSQGIRFENRYYTCERALEEQWFVRARERGVGKILITHDPRNVSRIYFRSESSAGLETCYLINEGNAFHNRDWYEVADEVELRGQMQEAAQSRKQQSKAEYHARTELIIATAKKKTQEVRVEQSNRARVMGIRDNRQVERETERMNTAWLLGNKDSTDQSNDQSNVPTLTGEVEASPDQPQQNASNGYVPPAQPIDKLRKLRERKLQDVE